MKRKKATDRLDMDGSTTVFSIRIAGYVHPLARRSYKTFPVMYSGKFVTCR